MRKINIKYLALGLSLCMLSACFEDESSEMGSFTDISIGEFESSYTVTSFAGNILSITPVIETPYSEDELNYVWTICPDQSDKSGYNYEYEQPTEISTDRNLAYEVNLAAGEYDLKLQVSAKENDYMVSQTTSVIVTTQFSQGFYILKENAEGNTDLDLLLDDGTHSTDLLSYLREDGALSGAPLDLSIAYNMAYTDDETGASNGANLLCVTTETGQIELYRDTDLKIIFDRSNLLYSGEMEADEMPYTIFNGYFGLHYFSNQRSSYSYVSDIGATTGKFGSPDVATCASVHALYAADYNVYFWNPEERAIYQSNYNGEVAIVTDINGMEVDLSNYECIAAGMSSFSGVPVFVLEDTATKERVVYTVSTRGTISTTYPISTTSHMATGEILRVNGQQAVMMYTTDGSNVYGYDWTTETERQFTLQGIPSGETINFLSNHYYNYRFDYLIVGTTTNGSDYKLYFYNTVGGVPDGTPAITVEGEGKVKKVHYLNASHSWGFGEFYPRTL